jgi:hypothetical protein
MFDHWEQAPATVITRESNDPGSYSTHPKYKYVMELRSPEGETFRAEVHDPIGGLPWTCRVPRVGESITVKVKWKNREVKIDTDDPALQQNLKAHQEAKDAGFAAALAGGTAAQPTAPGLKISVSPGAIFTINGKQVGGPANVANVADDLQRLATMHEQGLLNDAQFEDAKAKALRG